MPICSSETYVGLNHLDPVNSCTIERQQHLYMTSPENSHFIILGATTMVVPLQWLWVTDATFLCTNQLLLLVIWSVIPPAIPPKHLPIHAGNKDGVIQDIANYTDILQ